MKKTLAFCLALCLVLASGLCFAAEEPSGAYVDGLYHYDEPVTLTAISCYDMSGVDDPYSLWFYEWVRDKMNVNIELLDAISLEQFDTYNTMMFASDTLPDILLNWRFRGRAQYAELGDEQGMILPIGDYISEELTPNLYAIYTDATYGPIIEYELKTPAGNLYMFPRVQQSKKYSMDFAYMTLMVRSDWFAAVGYEAFPATLNEFRDALRKIKEQDPGAVGEGLVPLGGAYNDSNPMGNILNAFGFVGFSWNPIASLDGSYMDHDICFVGYSDRYYDYLEYMRSLYAEGLLEPDFFALTGQEVDANKSANLYAAVPSWAMFSYTDAPYDIAPLMSADADKAPVTGMYSEVYADSYLALTKECAHPEVAMRMMDPAYSEQYRGYYYYGPQVGVDDMYGLTEGWTYAENGIEKVFPGVMNGEIASAIAYGNTVSPFGYSGGPLDMRTNGAELTLYSMDVPSQRYSLQIYELLTPYTIGVYPGGQFDAETNNRVTDLQTVLVDHVNSETAKFITGVRELNEAEFVKYREELDAMGFAEYWALQEKAFEEQYR